MIIDTTAVGGCVNVIPTSLIADWIEGKYEVPPDILKMLQRWMLGVWLNSAPESSEDESN